jgi:hypothetical protein
MRIRSFWYDMAGCVQQLAGSTKEKVRRCSTGSKHLYLDQAGCGVEFGGFIEHLDEESYDQGWAEPERQDAYIFRRSPYVSFSNILY